MSTEWTPAQIPSLNGRRVVVTGANSGIGYHTAAMLARHGAEVVLACRDARRGEEALAKLRRNQPDAKLVFEPLDLASLASVHDFARRQLDQGRPLDLLINNAGVMAPPHRLETADGFERQFGTNVIGHFALTARLMPALEAAAQRAKDAPRIVTVASIAHKTGRIDFDDLQSTRHYGPMRAYRQSKLANLIFARELDRRLRAAGSRVMSVPAHPGVAKTNLFRDDRSVMTRAVRALLGEMIGAFLNSDVDGALPTLYAATAPDVEHGGYYGPLGLFEARGKRVGPAYVAPQALDADVANRLWQVCETLTGESFV
ncbi:SDR family oxidoreductase [Caballeronia sp. BR00000012568055]|uniref:SDR family oxidoreductase n=1 Tax=Caballeronia sp. BR00000012568055 TaxID=2918761 RepID=UPI0023FA000F|nr:SDR family oxidoreductase [Caballeronia sp. BR00000012568055]